MKWLKVLSVYYSYSSPVYEILHIIKDINLKPRQLLVHKNIELKYTNIVLHIEISKLCYIWYDQ